MKSEMELVQAMEDSEDRDVENYLKELREMLDNKTQDIEGLYRELKEFRAFRKGHHK
jgi:hypothetical protein